MVVSLHTRREKSCGSHLLVNPWYATASRDTGVESSVRSMGSGSGSGLGSGSGSLISQTLYALLRASLKIGTVRSSHGRERSIVNTISLGLQENSVSSALEVENEEANAMSVVAR